MLCNSLAPFLVNEVLALEHETMLIELFVFCGYKYSRSYVLILKFGARWRRVSVSHFPTLHKSDFRIHWIRGWECHTIDLDMMAEINIL